MKWLIIAAAFAASSVIGWLIGVFQSTEWVRPRYEQDCMAKLGYDPVACPVGGITGPLARGDRFVLWPACPERRTVARFDGPDVSDTLDGGHRVFLTTEAGAVVSCEEQWLRDHAARAKEGL